MIYKTEPPFIRLFLQTPAEENRASQFQKDTKKGAVLRENGWGFEFELPREDGVLRLFLRCVIGNHRKADEYWSKLLFLVKRQVN